MAATLVDESLPSGPSDKQPFGMNIRKAAYQVVNIAAKNREVLERYQRKRSDSIDLDDLDGLLSDDLDSDASVSIDSSSDSSAAATSESYLDVSAAKATQKSSKLLEIGSHHYSMAN